jgi:hypothetical protein
MHRFAGGEANVMPAVTSDPMTPAVMPSQDSYAWFTATSAERAPNWRNELTVRSMEMATEHEPIAYIRRVSPIPMLMIVATHDVVAPTELALECFERALEPKQLLMMPGGHFGAYEGDGFETCVSAAIDHYSRYL